MEIVPEWIPRHQVDVERWDRCIDNASNSRIYAYSGYLDRMSRNWDAMVWEDYKAVMPLTWNRKMGIFYAYQPPFCAQLGIFGNNLNREIVSRFLNQIPSKFQLIEIDLNAGNLFDPPVPPGNLRNNFILDLSPAYSFLERNFRENVRRNVRKCERMKCRYQTGFPVIEVIELSKRYVQKQAGYQDDDYNRFLGLFDFLSSRNQAETAGVFSESGQLLASCVFFYSGNRAYYILVGNHPNGKTLGASHFLIDQFIQSKAGRNLLLDFEGSDIRNLAFFYESFGSVPEVYPAIRVNRLPGWLSWLKGARKKNT